MLLEKRLSPRRGAPTLPSSAGGSPPPVIPQARCADEVRRCRAGGDEEQAPFLVECRGGPGVGAAGVRKGTLCPRLRTALAGCRDHVELPDELAVDGAEGADGAGEGVRPLGCGKPVMILSSNTTPGAVRAKWPPRSSSFGRMLSLPPLPKDSTSEPSSALRAMSSAPAAKRMRRSLPRSHYMRPRWAALGRSSSSLRHTSLPVAAFRANGTTDGERP